jgi:hypothetical protein
VFAAYALARGTPSDEPWIAAFKLGACLALLELLVLVGRSPADLAFVRRSSTNTPALDWARASRLKQWAHCGARSAAVDSKPL